MAWPGGDNNVTGSMRRHRRASVGSTAGYHPTSPSGRSGSSPPKMDGTECFSQTIRLPTHAGELGVEYVLNTIVAKLPAACGSTHDHKRPRNMTGS